MQKKIFLVFVTLILIAVLTTGFLSLGLIKATYLNDTKDKLITTSNLIHEFLMNRDNLKEINLDNLASAYSIKTNTRVTFIDKDGWVIGDSDLDIKSLENHKNRVEVRKAFEGNVGISERYSESLDEKMLYVAISFKKEDHKLSVIRLSVPLKDINRFNRVIFRYISISIITGSLIALILGYRYVKSITEPVKELTIVTKNISNGNYGEKVYFKTDDELGILADNFNIMSEKLQETIEEIEERSTKTKAILTSMINGIIALDNNNKVMFINPAAEEIFGVDEEDVKGKDILEVVKSNLLDEQVQNLIRDRVVSKKEIEIVEPIHRILNIYLNEIRLSHDPNRKIGIVIIVQDITEIRKLERMRKDFVANVSHELKTPLTSIIGFIETLKNGAIEQKDLRDKFINIIDIEASRLKALVEDLLVLTEIENKHDAVNIERIDVNKSIDEVIQIVNELSKRKNIEIIEKVNRKLPNIFGNMSWFKQMLINLLDNGIKYTPEGGKVTITGYYVDNKVIIKIKDTGIGIERKHLTRLFERFYRVDKARSRKVAGTGLGLAIVKHIVIAFKGKIDIKSETNKGTEFTIILPVEDLDET